MELSPIRDGQEVVEDYRAVGLTLRQHPVAFLRPELDRRGMTRCVDLAHIRDGRRVVVAGIVLVRQKPGSAKGVMFITIEDEGGNRQPDPVAGPVRGAAGTGAVGGMIACHGQVQSDGAVIHVVTDRLEDLSGPLRSVGDAEGTFPLTHGRGDGATHPASADPREGPGAGPGGRPVRNIYIPDLRLGSGIKVPMRDFR